MDWRKWTKSLLKTLLLFGIVLFLGWIFECVIAKGELDLIVIAFAYMLSDTTIRYYEKEKQDMTEHDILNLIDDISKAKNRIMSGLKSFYKDKLSAYTEDSPLNVDITIEPDDAVGLSTLDMPHIIKIWYDKEYDSIEFQIDNYGYAEWGIESFSLDEHYQIIEYLMKIDYGKGNI